MTRRSRSLPTDVRSRVRLDRGERIVAAAEVDDGWVVATTWSLHLLGGGVQDVPWTGILSARWDPDDGTFTIEFIDPAASTLVVTMVDEPRSFLRAVRELVDDSVVLREEVRIEDGRTAVVAVRRGRRGLESTIVVDGVPTRSAVAERLAVRLMEHAGMGS